VRGIKFVYFDLDDTLCGYWDASKAALRTTFELHGPEGFTPEEMVIHWAEAYREYAPLIKTPEWYPQYLESGDVTRKEHMRRVLARMEIVDDEITQKLADHYRYQRNANLQLFPDAISVLTELKKHFGIGLITNGPADIQREEIATLGIEGFLDHVWIEGEMKEGKPKVGVFDRATAAAGVSREEILMVGNSYGHDIEPAIRYGWKTAWIRRPSDVPPSAKHTEPESRPADKPEPTVEIGSLSELLPLLVA
jgi:putative hydrolase of the HAD superfamily